MYVIAYDLDVAAAGRFHPRGSRQAYVDLQQTLGRHGFERVQWSVYAERTEDLTRLYGALRELETLPWLAASVTSIRVFRMEDGTDFTEIYRRAPRDR